MQVSLRSNRSARSYFKAWLSVFFPKRGTAKTRLPSTELIKQERHQYKDTKDKERTEIKLSEGWRQQEQGEKSQNWYLD